MSDIQHNFQVKLLGHVTISGEIEAVTGLHIGGTGDAIDKGGIDHPVIKNPVTNEPYIPGSSLRGRMRSLLEKKGGRKLSEMATGVWMEIYKDETDENKKKAKKSEVCRVFGNAQTGLPSILIVRDALYTDDTKLRYIESDLPITEAKIEIAVDRITAHALPRTIERVPSGARFAFSMVYRVQEDENRPDAITNVQKDLENILWALEEIETHDGLGGNTTRGHGQVKFYLKPIRLVRYKKTEKSEEINAEQVTGGLTEAVEIGCNDEQLEIQCEKKTETGFCSVGDLNAKLQDIAKKFNDNPLDSINH